MTFKELGVSKEFEKNLEKLGIKEPRDVQRKSVKEALSGEDLLVQAATGSGKTLAFSIGVLEGLDSKESSISSLIITPTRELAHQVAKEIRKFAKHIPNVKVLELIGGVPTKRQKHSLSHGAHIVVGTPGRLCHHLRDGSLDLSRTKTVVLDEADRILEMGFLEDTAAILKELPRKRQTLLFSATFDEEVLKVSRDFQSTPKHIEVESQDSLIEEFTISCEESKKSQYVLKVLEHFQPVKTLIFCNTKVAVEDLENYLYDSRVGVSSLFGDLTQDERSDTTIQFRNGSLKVLVATNIAARGLDIAELDLVINYDVAFEESSHTHRVGRTGRGQVGRAVTFNSKVNGDSKELDLKSLIQKPFKRAEFFTLLIEGGKKDKLRPGDIVGSLTKSLDLNGESIGDIDIVERISYVALKASEKKSLKNLKSLKVKGKKFRVFLL